MSRTKVPREPVSFDMRENAGVVRRGETRAPGERKSKRPPAAQRRVTNCFSFYRGPVVGIQWYEDARRDNVSVSARGQSRNRGEMRPRLDANDVVSMSPR